MIGDDDFEQELREIFKEQFINSALHVKQSIVALGNCDTYKESVDNLFRIFHGIKANSVYFHYKNIAKLALSVENVLTALRDVNPPISEDILEWFDKVSGQYTLWANEMQEGDDTLSSLNQEILSAVQIGAQAKNSAVLLKEQSIVYFNKNKKVSSKLLAMLNKYAASVVHISHASAFEKYLKEQKPNICIMDIGEGCVDASKIFYKYIPTSALIVFLDKSDKNTHIKLGLKGIHHIITRPIMQDALYRELLRVVDSHFTSRRFIIDNSKIQAFIQTLHPLSDSILQIQKVCNSNESSIKDLIKVVKKDPLASGMILQAAKSPLYNLEEINTVDHAITLLGKRKVQAIALTQARDAFDTAGLHVYNINDTVFSNVATLRLILMIKWYSKVSISALAILSTTAILGNIGQLLLAQEIQKMGKEEEFLNFAKKYSMEYAEEKILQTSTPLVSSDIASFWELDSDIVDSLRYSDNPKNAPDEVYDLALANYVVFRIIKLDGTIEAEIPKRVKKALLDKGLSLQSLQNALDTILKLEI